MDFESWKSLKKKIEALPPSIRIKKYLEMLKEEELSKQIADEILELIEKASIEVEIFAAETKSANPVKNETIESNVLPEKKEELVEIVKEVQLSNDDSETNSNYSQSESEQKYFNKYEKKYIPRPMQTTSEISIVNVEQSSEDLYKSDSSKSSKKKKDQRAEY